MFKFGGNDAAPAPKCYFTHAPLPDHIDPKQPPTKKKPFSVISSQPLSHTADLILPEELYEEVKQELEGHVGTFHYAKVIMSLGDIISGDFFNQYIKTGNILMISEGRPGIDNTYTLHEGVLRLDLDKATYERCGLVGKPAPHGGRKHTKARYVIETNLREPSMLHGKKGFERHVWTFKNVLNNSLTWLFHDLSNPKQEPSGPILAHQPHLLPTPPTPHHLPGTKIPQLTPSSIPDLLDADHSAAVLEWLGMVSLASPRLAADDAIDSYLSRYEVPVPYRSDGASDAEAVAVSGLVRLRWRGLVPAWFVLSVWLAVRGRMEALSREEEERSKRWVALSVTGFGGGMYTLLGVGARDVLVWECR